MKGACRSQAIRPSATVSDLSCSNDGELPDSATSHNWLEIAVSVPEWGKSDKAKMPRLLSMMSSTTLLKSQSDPSRYMWAKLRMSEHVDVPHFPSGTAVFRRGGKADIHVDGLR
jgi:hypothetical protein